MLIKWIRKIKKLLIEKNKLLLPNTVNVNK